jgi:phosphatidylserine/phosphatidylglycerophosphate/cardiolipin synthase-like enzyme
MTLEDAIREIAVALPSGHVERLAAAAERFEGPGADADAALSRAAPIPAVRERARILGEAWKACADVPGRLVALALRSASQAVEAARKAASLELTWTGPVTGMPVRMTGEAILDVVRDARESLLFMSYSGSEIEELVAEIQRACNRGVAVTMVFETRAGSGGALSTDAAAAYEALSGAVTFLEWPPDQRDAPGRMHAKAVVGDATVAVVSSANLSRAAMATNMELGILVRGGPMPLWISDHVSSLRAKGVLKKPVV